MSKNVFRDDGYIVFHEYGSTFDNPPTGREDANFTVDTFGLFVQQALWMYQGRIKPLAVDSNRTLQLPFAIVPLEEGMVVTNVRTGRTYEIGSVTERYRQMQYTEPTVANTPESIVIRPRTFVRAGTDGYHPDEILGCTVQLRGDDIDIDVKQGDFLSIESSGRVGCRQIYAESRSYEGSDYSIQYRIETHQPGRDKEFLGSSRGIKPTPRNSVNMATNDPTMVASVKAQTFHSVIEFELNAPNAFELNLLTNWFECFMDRYSGIFRRLGFPQVFYYDRRDLTDRDVEKPLTGSKRVLRYGLITERIWPGVLPKLRQVDLEVTKQD